NDFISRLNDHVPVKNKLLKSLAGTDNSVFGKFSLNLDLVTGGLPDQFAERATGTAVFSVADGRLVNVGWTEGLSSALSKVHSSLGGKEFTFSELKGDLVIDKGKLLVRALDFGAPPFGTARATGTLGLDNSVAL